MNFNLFTFSFFSYSAKIITDITTPLSYAINIARELEIPTIVGLEGSSSHE
ncbi:MAG: PEP-utilizing enzyme [Promethearchaeota archaeon]